MKKYKTTVTLLPYWQWTKTEHIRMWECTECLWHMNFELDEGFLLEDGWRHAEVVRTVPNHRSARLIQAEVYINAHAWIGRAKQWWSPAQLAQLFATVVKLTRTFTALFFSLARKLGVLQLSLQHHILSSTFVWRGSVSFYLSNVFISARGSTVWINAGDIYKTIPRRWDVSRATLVFWGFGWVFNHNFMSVTLSNE